MRRDPCCWSTFETSSEDLWFRWWVLLCSGEAPPTPAAHAMVLWAQGNCPWDFLHLFRSSALESGGNVYLICMLMAWPLLSTFWSVCGRAHTNNILNYIFVPQNSMQIAWYAWYCWNSTSQFIRFLWPLCSSLSLDSERLLPCWMSGCTAPSRRVQALWTCRSKPMGAGVLCCKVDGCNLQCVCVCLVYRHPKICVFPEESWAMIEGTEGRRRIQMTHKFLQFLDSTERWLFLAMWQLSYTKLAPNGFPTSPPQQNHSWKWLHPIFRLSVSYNPSFLRFNYFKSEIPHVFEIWSSKESMTWCIYAAVLLYDPFASSRPCRFWHHQRVEVVTLKRSKKFCGTLRCRVMG